MVQGFASCLRCALRSLVLQDAQIKVVRDTVITAILLQIRRSGGPTAASSVHRVDAVPNQRELGASIEDETRRRVTVRFAEEAQIDRLRPSLDDFEGRVDRRWARRLSRAATVSARRTRATALALAPLERFRWRLRSSSCCLAIAMYCAVAAASWTLSGSQP